MPVLAWMAAKFGISKGPIIAILILLGVMILGSVGAYFYIQHEENQIISLHDKVNRQELQIGGLQLQDKTYKDDLEKQKKIASDVQQNNAILNRNFDKLSRALNDAHYKEQAVKDPTGVQNSVNKDLRDYNRCVAIAAGSPILPEETTVPVEQRNVACPDYFGYKDKQ